MSALRSYEDFEPFFEWVHAEGFITLLIHLPGFKRNQIKVQIIPDFNHVKISGERPLDDRRWSRFVKQFPLPEHCKVAEIRAKLENGELHVRFPIAQIAPSTTMHISPSSPMEKAAIELREKTQEGDGKSRKAVAEGEFLQKEQKQPEAKEEFDHKEHPKANGDQEKKQEKLQDKEKTEEGRSNGEKKLGQQMSPALKADDTFTQEKETEQPESKGGEMMAKYSINNLLIELTPDKKILLVNVAVSALVFLGIGLYFMYKREDK